MGQGEKGNFGLGGYCFDLGIGKDQFSGDRIVPKSGIDLGDGLSGILTGGHQNNLDLGMVQQTPQ